MNEQDINKAMRAGSWVLVAALIIAVGWYYRATREGVAAQTVAQLHSQYLMGLNLLVAEAHAYSKTDDSIIPLLKTITATNALSHAMTNAPTSAVTNEAPQPAR